MQMLTSEKTNGALEAVLICLMEVSQLAEFALEEGYANFNLGNN